MAFNNEVRLRGFCAQKPKMTSTSDGRQKVVLVIYTRDYFYKHEITQAHRCIAKGKKAEVIFRNAEKGKHIEVRGMSLSYRIGDGKNARYYNYVLIEEFSFTPVQGRMALKETIRDILTTENITSCDQLDFDKI